MILVGTFSWIHTLRPDGDPAVRERVTAALAGGRAGARWCSLSCGTEHAAPTSENVLEDFAEALPALVIDDDVWEHAHELARRARARGITVPAADVLIMACGERHGAALETADRDFELLGPVIVRPPAAGVREPVARTDTTLRRYHVPWVRQHPVPGQARGGRGT